MGAGRFHAYPAIGKADTKRTITYEHRTQIGNWGKRTVTTLHGPNKEKDSQLITRGGTAGYQLINKVERGGSQDVLISNPLPGF